MIHARHPLLISSLVFAASVSTVPVRAQDAHYWSVQNGARATVLGGAVVAGDGDLSATYYNPASLVKVREGAVMSTFSRTITDVEVDTRASAGVLGSSRLGASAPRFFAARLPFHLLDDDVLAVSFAVRNSAKLDLGGHLTVGAGPVLESRDLSLFQDIYDGWYGLSRAYDPGPVAVGVSVFLSSVSYRQRIATSFVRLAPEPDGYSGTDYSHFDLGVRRVIAKVGAHWEHGPVRLGAAMTLPSVGLPGNSGTLSVGHTRLAENPSTSDEVADTRQEGVPADFRRPLSLALGAELGLGRLDLSAVAEWFDAVDDHAVLAVQPFSAATPRRGVTTPVRQARRSVVNAGAGFSLQLGAGAFIFGSARTDRSFSDPDRPTIVGLGAYDLAHFTGGVGIVHERVDLWVGVQRSRGGEDRAFRASLLPSAQEFDARMRFRGIGLIAAVGASL